MVGFVHLHVHSDFSLLDAAVSVMSLADKAEALGMKALALTDHGNMFGIMEFIAACKETIVESSEGEKEHRPRKNPIKPIIGCEVYVSPGSRFEKKGTEGDNKYYHLILLAATREGYFNLVKLCTFAYTEGFYYRPRIDEELLAEYHGGLIALSACVSGEIPRLIRAGKMAEAEQKALYYRDLFGADGQGRPNFYLEIQDHGIPADVLKCPFSQRDINREIAAISHKTGIPLVATNDVHYLNRDDSEAHDVLLCIGTAQFQNAEKRKKQYYGDQFFLKSGDEMSVLFREYPDAVVNTGSIAGRCAADIPEITSKELPNYLPECDLPPGFASAGGYLRHLAAEGLVRRYPRAFDAWKNEAGGNEWPEIQKRLDYELDVIINMGFTGYFLIVVDFINWAREHDISVGPGRGSGAGSIVAYALQITNIDPLKYGLLFERFLNPERVTMPDFDIDFANEGRDDVIKYVTGKYGKERVGQIITFGTLGAKAVIKDVARTLGISIGESEKIAKLIPLRPGITLKKAFEEEPRLREIESDPAYTRLFALARKLEGLNRHSSLHASGVVIGKSALHDLLPLFKDTKTGAIATQYDMNHLEKCGLVKMDFLGLKTLDVIKHTEGLIRLRGGEYAGFSIEAVSEDDEATFKMLGEGQSFEIFQFESDGMRDVLKRAKPGKVEDLIALNALYRPGPMANIPRFIDSKNGIQAISYPDPSLEETLKETYGVIVYQEQVMQVARIIAGFTLGHADELRRAMGKKIMEKMVREKKKFIAGARERGYSEKKADDIFELLVPFAGYGFNKSHAAGYAVLAYRTAYLKANFPAEFMAASLTNEIYSQDKDKLSGCIAEVRKMGLVIDPPDINNSQKLFTVVDGRLVYGLLGIKGLGDGPADEIVHCRQEAPYRDFMDFLNRVDIKGVGKSVIERLIQTGAFDRLGTRREILLGNLDRAVEYVLKIQDDKKEGQGSLFGDTGEKEYPDFIFEDFPETGRADKLNIEKELIGFYFSGHPMDEYRKIWQKAVKADLGHPENLIPGSHILVGLLKNVKPITTGKGEKMAFASLEDYNGEIEITFFPGVWEKYRDKIENDKVVVLKGKIDYQKNKDKYSFAVDEYLETDDLERAVREEEAQARKWDKYRNIWKYAKDLDLRLLDLGALAGAAPGTYTVLGAVKSLRTHIDKNGKEMAFGTIQNFRGEVDAVFFARPWENCKALVALDEILALKGTVDPPREKKPEGNSGSDGSRRSVRPGFVVSSMHDLNKLVRAAAKMADRQSSGISGRVSGETPAGETPADKNPAGEIPAGETTAKTGAEKTAGADAAVYREVHIRLAAAAAGNEMALYSIRDCLEGNPGACPVFIHIPALEGETVIRTTGKIDAGIPESVGLLAKCAGVTEVWCA